MTEEKETKLESICTDTDIDISRGGVALIAKHYSNGDFQAAGSGSVLGDMAATHKISAQSAFIL